MDYSRWPEFELIALANVYLRHKQPHRAQDLRTEVGRRLESIDMPGLRAVYEKLDVSNVVHFRQRIVGFLHLKKLA
jgi:hypothetical protein